MRWTLLCIVLALAACTPSPNSPASPDASDAAPRAVPTSASAQCAAACAAMAAAGCQEGSDPACPLTMTKVESDRLIRTPSGQPVTCAGCAAAKTAADVGASCGSSCTP